MPTKRKSSEFSSRAKRHKAFSTSTELSGESLSILNLPLEILDQILAYIIKIPWHPRNATFPKSAICHLFSPNALHINRLLRTRALHVISSTSLWMNIKCMDRSVDDSLNGLENVVPAVPEVFKARLLDPLPEVTLEIGSLPRGATRKSARTQKSVLFPFNYHSFSIIYPRIMTCARYVQCLNIRILPMSSSLQSIVD